ncbi:MAG: pantetheine-phosphate adenylyltransferase [Nannocystaceae bacterium]|nr:pantetheine-phosphate adenylyltransferase [Nannocystaceae bacterium]
MTLGHMDIMERAVKLFDRVIVGIGQHPTKRGWFTPQQRCELIAESIEHLPSVDVAVFSSLVIDFCKEVGAGFIVRGLRAHGDFESEFQMALANRDLEPSVETVFILPRPNRMIVSSSLVREVATHGGDYGRYVADPVARAIQARLDAR